MGPQPALKSRIRSTEPLAKIFNTQEMVTSSHIARARDMAPNAKPYTDAIFGVAQALVAHTRITHPTAVRDERNSCVVVFAFTSDRGMADPYTSSIIREMESLLSRPDVTGKQPELFVYGRRGSTYYRHRNCNVVATQEGDTDQPGVEIAETIPNTLMDACMRPAEKDGVSELYIVYTEFINMVVQKVRVLCTLPIEVVKNEAKMPDPDEEAPAIANVVPLYTFRPSLEKVPDATLLKYIQSHIHECLLTAAASETASCRNAIHMVTDNVRNLINGPMHKLSASRQASITQEFTEIIGSADALTKKGEQERI